MVVFKYITKITARFIIALGTFKSARLRQSWAGGLPQTIQGDYS